MKLRELVPSIMRIDLIVPALGLVVWRGYIWALHDARTKSEKHRQEQIFVQRELTERIADRETYIQWGVMLHQA